MTCPPPDPYRWLRDLFLGHPHLLGEVLEGLLGMRPPPHLSAAPRAGDLLLRAQGGAVPWYLLSLQAAPDPSRVLSWPRLWLDALSEERERGWLVVLTDSDEVAAWVRGPAFRPRHGVWTCPLLLDLQRHAEALGHRGRPLLTALGLWAARRWPGRLLRPLLDRLAAELSAADDPRLGVPLLLGVRSFLDEDARRHLAAFPVRGRPRLQWAAAGLAADRRGQRDEGE